jgi:hypothetical protein
MIAAGKPNDDTNISSRESSGSSRTESATAAAQQKVAAEICASESFRAVATTSIPPAEEVALAGIVSTGTAAAA